MGGADRGKAERERNSADAPAASAEDLIARSEATKQSPSFPEGEIASLPPVARNDAC